ncbi:MAG: hypothetical protein JWM31_2270 [Solirubrobacterales bacterium]|nr:hypothetical protein [Solirubrobacterales bacterium]
MDEERKRGRLSTGFSDIFNNVSSVALLIFAGVLFLAGAVGGVGLVSRLGGAGWFMYTLVIGTYALVFGPVIASAVTLRQKGSPRHRAAIEKRREHQRRKYRLEYLESEEGQARKGMSSEGRAKATTSTTPASVTKGPTDTDETATNPGSAPPGGDTMR